MVIRTIEDLHRVIGLAIDLAHQDYMDGNVKVCPKTGATIPSWRDMSGLTIAKRVGITQWMKGHERALMAAYRGALATLDYSA